MSDTVLEGKTAVQFNARSAEDVFTFQFDQKDWPSNEISAYLGKQLKYNSKEFIGVNTVKKSNLKANNKESRLAGFGL